MKRSIRTLAAFCAACLIGSATLNAQNEVIRLDDDITIKVDRKLYPDFKKTIPHEEEAPYAAARRARKAAGIKVELPDHVNNGEDKYFPPIFNQDGGSCGSAQSIGYMFTHEINSWRDLDASLPENQYPTHFTWLLTYNGSDKEEMAKANGVPNVATYGGRTYSKLFGVQTHEDVDFGWMQGYDKWYSAMWNRAASTFSMAATNTPEGRQELKEWLYNHCGDETMHSGGIAGIGVAAYGTWKKIPASANNKAIGVNGMSYVDRWGDTYNHALTVCGYDDRIEFDLDGDGKVGEVDEDEVGAWIIANSWGDGWENKGFIYCPYKYSYAVEKFEGGPWSPGTYIIRRDYRPLRTIKLNMEYDHRSELLLCAGISDNVEATQPDQIISFEHFKNAGNPQNLNPAPEVPMLGRWADGMHYEPMEFGYDLTDLTSAFDRTKPLKYFFIVKTKSTAIGKGFIHSASIINYEIDPDGIEIPFDTKDITILNKGKQTIISVVVPGEQLYAPTNLTLTDSTLQWTAPQPSGLPFKGYRIYHAGQLMDSVAAPQTTYTPAALGEEPYTVTAVYAAGGYTQESGHTNAVASYSPTSGDNNVAIFNQGGMTIPNAVTETLCQATIEFWMRSDLNKSYDQQIGPGWGNFLFHTDNSGQLYFGWNTTSGDRMIIPNIFKVGKWCHVAIVVDANKMTAYVNGVRKGQITSSGYSGLSAFGDLKIGNSGENQFWKGGIDELRVWKKALTQDEVKAGMNSRIAFPAVQEDLLIYLPMDTIVVDGVTKLRELASGKHAKIHLTGSWNSEVNNDFITGSPEHSASIKAVDTDYIAGIPLQLKASSPVDAISWAWHAADARITDVQGMSPYFVFDEPGTHTVTLTVTFTDGESVVTSTEVEVTEGQAPVADFSINAVTLPAGDRFSFVNTTVGEGCQFQWFMPGAEVETSTGTNAGALYPTLGTFDVTLTATNAFGSSSVTKQVTVTAAAPAARFDVQPVSVLLGDTVHLIDQSRYEPTGWSWELTNGHRGFSIGGQNPDIVPVAPGIYDVALTATNDLGSGSTSKGSILMVSNADAKTALHFTGSERITFANPFTEAASGFTIDWWMRPSALANAVSMKASSGIISTACDETGTVTVTLDGAKVSSPEGYAVKGEWHHYALVFSQGDISFYRDAILVGTVNGALEDVCPAQQGTITLANGFNGLIDEFRIWLSALSLSDIRRYANVPITDRATAEALRALAIYYDFNQNGGDVIDRTSHANDATRIDFGPDGDAWNSALGVFTLDLGAEPAGDITARYLTNYQRPYYTANGTVNPNNSSRFKRLEMGTARSGWKEANGVKAGSITTGAHIDTDHHGDITFETVWSGFAQNLVDYRLWQTIALPAGRYTFSCTFSDGSDSQNSRIAVCYGNLMVGDDDCEKAAIAWNKLSEGTVSFTLEQTSEVSIGIIVNLIGQASFNISSFKLEGIPFEDIHAVSDDASAEYGYLIFPSATSDELQPAKALFAYTDSTLAWHDFDATDPSQLWHHTSNEGDITFTNVATGYTFTTDAQLSFLLCHCDSLTESGLAFAADDASAPVESVESFTATLTAVSAAALSNARTQVALAAARAALSAAYTSGGLLASIQSDSVQAIEPTDSTDAHIDLQFAEPMAEVILTASFPSDACRPSKVILLASNDSITWTPVHTFYNLTSAQPYGLSPEADEWASGYLTLGDSYRYLRFEVGNINYDDGGTSNLTDGHHRFMISSLRAYVPQVDDQKATLASDFAALVMDVEARHRAGVAGDYDIRRLADATLVFASYNSAAYASLAACVTEFTSDGNDYMSGIYERGTADAYLLLLRQAQSALAERASDDESYARLEAELREAYAAIIVRRDLDDGIYYIDNAWFPDFVKGLYAFDTNHVAWNNADRENPSFLWEVKYLDTTRQGCRYIIRNIGTNRILHTSSADYALLTGPKVSSYQLVSMVDEDAYNIRSERSKLILTPDFSDEGNGVGGRAIGLPEETSTATWRFVPATDEQIAAIGSRMEADAAMLAMTEVLPFTDEYPLITDAKQVSTNHPGTGRANFANLLDSKASTTYQTRSTLYTLADIATTSKPYIEVALPRLVQKFWLTTRAYNATNTVMRPMRISISASTDGETWTECNTLQNIANAYPQDGGYITDKATDWCSPLIDLGAAYSYVRITVDEVNYRSHTGNNNLYNDFALSEFQLYDADITVNIAQPTTTEAPSDAIYTPDGRYVGTDPTRLTKGLYISGTRKVIVK